VEKNGMVSFRSMVRVAKDMPRVRRIIKRIFGLKKLNDGVSATLGRE
jgi:hypothetical protein